MKKVMMVMTMFTALSFLVSMIAVAPLFAVEATNTGPTPKQVPTQKPKPQLSKDKAMVHTKFWEFEFDRLEGKGVVIKKGGGNKTINVKVGENVKFTLYYKVKTPPIKEIFEADVNAWGSGAREYYGTFWIHDKERNQETNSMDMRYLPKFTWENVQFWKKTFLGTSCKTWTEQMTLQWTPTAEFVGHTVFIKVCCVNCWSNKDIPEVDRKNNGFTNEDLLVTFIVAP